MRKTTETGSVIVSVNKDAAEALGIMHTGLAPVEIRYSRRTL
jgi:rare lipoprotein A (peptidoglycan hydrolase)